jgi:hypothetical protein
LNKATLESADGGIRAAVECLFFFFFFLVWFSWLSQRESVWMSVPTTDCLEDVPTDGIP